VKPLKLCIHADEFNELIGDEFIPMINKAGGAGFQVVAYTQTTSDIEAKIGNAAKARQIEGNFNTRIYMRILDEATSKGFIDRLHEVDIATVNTASRSMDSNDPEEFADFGSASADSITVVKAPMLSSADLGRLPKGHAFALLNGGQLYKLRIPLLETDGDEHFLGSFEDIAGHIGLRYRDPEPVSPQIAAPAVAR
jgi:conjugal transfer pilus assembly protein TraD